MNSFNSINPRPTILLIIFLLLMGKASSQSFLNGDFEINSVIDDCTQNIDMSNIDLNASMPNVYAFGDNDVIHSTGGQIDVFGPSSCYGTAQATAQSGNWNIAIIANWKGVDAIALELSAPLLVGETYHLSFWTNAYSGSGITPGQLKVGYSTSNNVFGTEISTITQGVDDWVNHVVTFTPSEAANFITFSAIYADDFSVNLTQIDNFSIEVNSAPTNIEATSLAIDENMDAGTLVGTLSSVDANIGDTFSYSLIAGIGADDNVSFVINGSTLETAAIFDYETKETYTVRIQTTDAGGLTFEKQFDINVNDAPTGLINGDFEDRAINHPCNDGFNLTNLEFNASINNVVGFGTLEDIDFHVSSCSSTSSYLPVSGNVCVSLGVNHNGKSGYDAISIELSEPLQVGAEYQVDFQMLGYDLSGFTHSKIEIGESTSSTDFGTKLDEFTPTDGIWLAGSTQFIASLAATHITVRAIDEGVAGITELDQFMISLITPAPPPNQIPVSVPESVSLQEGGSTSTLSGGGTSVLDNDTDADGDPLTAVLVDDVSSGILTLNNDGTFSYVHDGTNSTTDFFTYKASDGTSDGNTVSVQIAIAPVNDAPLFTLDSDHMVNEDAGAQTVSGWATGISDGDDESQSLTFNVSNDNNGLFSAQPSINASGELSYTPAADGHGVATVTVSLSDNGGTANGGVDISGDQTFTITVNSVNDAPLFTLDSDHTVNEDAGAQTVSGWATGISDGDDESQSLTFNVSNDNNGLFSAQPSINASGELSYTPAADGHGVATVTVSLSDNGGTANGGVDISGDQTFTITVNSVNDAPLFTLDSDHTVNEDAGAQTVSGWATGISDGDDESQSLTFNVSNDNNGLFSAQPSINASGELSYTPAADGHGVATVTVSLSDNGGTANGGVDISGDQTFTITVNSVNDAPLFTLDSDHTVNEDAGAQTVSGWATGISDGDDESQSLTFNVSNDNNGLFSAQPSINASGELSYTPAADGHGVATVTVSLSDNGGTANGGVDISGDQTFTITVNSVNDAPLFTLDSDHTVNEDAGAQTVSGWATGISDGDDESQSLTFNVSNDNNGLFSAQPSINASGELSYTPAADGHGVATVTVSLSDNGGTANGGVDISGDQTFTITVNSVNDAPLFTLDSDHMVNEDAGAQTVSGWATGISDGDDESQSLTFNVSNDNNGLFSAQPSINASGELSYTPAADGHGVATVTVSLSDNGGTANGGVDISGDQTFTITVNSVNDAPLFTLDSDHTVNEDAGAQTVSGWATGISDGDDESQSLTFNVSNDNNGLFSAQPSINASGELSYTPAADGHGVATVTVSLSDNGGTANGGVDISGDQTFTITVNSVNDAPLFTLDSDHTVNEDAGAQTVSGWATGISDGDDESQSLTFNVSNDNNGLFSAQPSINASGELSYTPAADGHGVATVTVSLSDNGGTANGGVDISGDQTFTITVNSVNDAPMINLIGTLQVIENATLIHTISASDIEGDAITYSLDATSIGKGMTIGSSSGVLSWSPSSTYLGDHTVTVTATDNGVPSESISETFTITVAVEGTPVVDAGIDNQSAVEDQAFSLTIPNNAFSDPDGTGTVSDLTYAVLQSDGTALPGWLTFSGDTFSGTPLNTDAGVTLTIEVTATDLDSRPVSTTFELVVHSVNDAPVITEIENQTLVVGESFSYTVAATDEEGDAITYSLDATSRGLGASIGESNGLLEWSSVSPVGSYTVIVTATDNGTPTASSSIAFGLIVSLGNTAPVAAEDSYTITSGTLLEVDASSGVLANDSDSDGDDLTAILKSTTSMGVLTLNADGSFSYTSSSTFEGTDSFTYVANDGENDSKVVNVQITVEKALSVGDLNIEVNTFPNPFIDEFMLKVEEVSKGDVTIFIRDLGGRLIYDEKIEHKGGAMKHIINLEDKAEGVMFLELKGENERFVRRIVKK